MSDCSYTPLSSENSFDADCYNNPTSEDSSRSSSILDSAIDVLKILYERIDEGKIAFHDALSKRSVTYCYYFNSDKLSTIWKDKPDELKNILGLRIYLRFAPEESKNNRKYVIESLNRHYGSPENYKYASEELKKDPLIIANVLKREIRGYNAPDEIIEMVFEKAPLKSILKSLIILNLYRNNLGQDSVLSIIYNRYTEVEIARELCSLISEDVSNYEEIKFLFNLFIREVHLKVVEQNGLALKYLTCSPEIGEMSWVLSNREIVTAAVKQNGLALKYADDFIRDETIVKLAVRQNGLALRYAAPELRSDEIIVAAAVEQNRLALQYAAPELRGAQEIDRHAFGDSKTYTLDLQKVENDPLSVLRDLQELLRKNHSFPKIVYKGSEGIDAGGLSRDLVTRLFKEIFQKENPYLPVFAWERGWLPVVHADFDSAEEKYQTQLLYQAIGMIFAAAIQKGEKPIVTGEHFHALLFELLYSLSLKDILVLPEQFTSLDDFPAGESLLKKMLISHLARKLDGSEEQKKETAQELVEAFLENRFPDSFGVFNSKEEFLQQYPGMGKIVQAAPGVLAIAQGMRRVLNGWELNSDSAGKLQLNIQGYFSRDAILQSLSWKNEEVGDPEQNERTKKFFKKWLEDETTSLEMISDLLFTLTGSCTLRDGQNLLVSLYSAEGPEEGMEWFPKFHTCSSSMEIPRNYSDYATFKKMLEAGIKSAKYGFQAR